MNFKKLPIYAMTCTLLWGAISCESPLKDFNLVISSEVIKHSATLQVRDTGNEPVNNVTIKLLSGDTEDIYNLSGYKDFKLNGDMVTFGVDPKRTPTAANPITFRIEISGAGYLTQVVPVTIADVSTGIQPVQLVKPTEVPDGVEVIVENIQLGANGTLAAATTIVLDKEGEGTKGNIDISLPAGLQFRDASGNAIVGGVLTANVSSIDASDPAALALFPGGKLTSDAVVGPNGETQSGTFNPAATTVIKMSVGGTSVRQFSAPIAISMGINPDFVDATTGQPVMAGTQLSIYSYDESDPNAVWKYEKNATVTGSAATGYSLNFDIDHLTTFVAGNFVASCDPVSTIDFTADWMAQGFTYPLVVQAVQHGNVIASSTFSISESNKTAALAYLPANAGVQIVVRNNDGDIVAQAPLAACGSATTINLPDPNPVIEPKVTLQLYVRCPGQTNVLTVLPTFELQYRIAGTGTFEYLGQVTNGFLQTTLLKSDGTRYDFRAVYNDRVKVVNNKTVNEDNTGTVGIGANDIIGEKAGATNLAILTEECKN
ncbi:hypothetical protein FAZ15_13340 [Sphingobacterium olei]|uniref:DUF4493 domain-containing protein n=1 Tax=Sphingobacterium olei TaxID=2571155 RepID=A0A4U0PB34_9SPHI|nr:hypothetical protein [Sphingobacterium olei]TJZ59874.1 hypothetical protein FAZ15_13340 [Sphingobacterium olei]